MTLSFFLGTVVSEVSGGRVIGESGESKVWFQILLGSVYCVKSVEHKWHKDRDDIYSCTQDGCPCRGNSCNKFELEVSLQNGESPDLKPSCKWADTVHIAMNDFNEHLVPNIHELSIIDRSGYYDTRLRESRDFNVIL